MAGIATFAVTITTTGTAQQVPSITNQGRSLSLSAPAANAADITISASSTVTGGFVLPKGSSPITIPGVTDTAALWVSGTAGDHVTGIVSL